MKNLNNNADKTIKNIKFYFINILNKLLLSYDEFSSSESFPLFKSLHSKIKAMCISKIVIDEMATLIQNIVSIAILKSK